MYDDNNPPWDDEEFDPWPFLNRLIGLVFIVLGIILLWRFQGPLFLISKLMLILAGAVWGTGFRHPQTRRIRPLFWLAVGMMLIGMALGISGLQTRVFNLVAVYAFGGVVLVFGGRRLTLKK